MSSESRARQDTSRTELAIAISELVSGLPGVSGTAGTLSDNIKYIPGIHAPVKGVHLGEEDGIMKVDIYIIATYGTNIPQTAWDIQTEVKQFLNDKGYTELGDIDIHVQGVSDGEERS